ncbi:hypothetical protein KP509_25G035100 [Ceratopteris richardii]|uniref:Uncharacterized protein n=1 Tax=Ceratopteris richardii TaxID=49495 RepID=A0A8T2RP69_CERRI|nr:hypothetical protein KP509_25G035100 [Ceratopteris richardii]
MDPTDDCINSPPSPPPASTPLWISSPVRFRDSISRSRRSLLSAHFLGKEGQFEKTEGLCPAHVVCQPVAEDWPIPVDRLSKSLPSLSVSVFLDKKEEEALEPKTPPHSMTLAAPPMAPRKSSKQRVAPRGKQKPRRLTFENDDFSRAEGGGAGAMKPHSKSELKCLEKLKSATVDVVTPPQQVRRVTPPQQIRRSSTTIPAFISKAASRRILVQDSC